jgi:DNA-damage-inducible protein J
MTQINVSLDDSVKQEAETLLSALGMNLTTAITIFLRQTIRERGIPFPISTKPDPFYNPANMKWLEESIEQGKKGEYVVKTMDELERMADE